MTRTAIVTGGGTGIGREIARTLTGQGLDVTITGRRAGVLEKAAAELGVRTVAFDASDPAAVEAALPRLPERVDVLVNNAGGNAARDRPQVADGDLAGLRGLWLAQMEANVLSAVLVTAALTPRLADQARVVLMGSIAGERGGGSYGAAKAAVHMLTADLAASLGERGITVNAVAPGMVEDTEFFGASMTDERRRLMISQTRNGRVATPSDVAETVAFLTSPGAGHVTAQVVHVSGGAFLGR